MGILLHPLVYQQQSSQSAKMNDKQTETLHLGVPRTAKNFSGSEVSNFPFSPHEGTGRKYFHLCDPHGPQHKHAALLWKPKADMVWLGLAYRLWLSKPNFQQQSSSVLVHLEYVFSTLYSHAPKAMKSSCPSH